MQIEADLPNNHCVHGKESHNIMLFLLLFNDRAPAASIVFCCWVFLEYRNLIWNATVKAFKLSNSQIVVCATIRQVRSGPLLNQRRRLWHATAHISILFFQKKTSASASCYLLILPVLPWDCPLQLRNVENLGVSAPLLAAGCQWRRITAHVRHISIRWIREYLH